MWMHWDSKYIWLIAISIENGHIRTHFSCPRRLKKDLILMCSVFYIYGFLEPSVGGGSAIFKNVLKASYISSLTPSLANYLYGLFGILVRSANQLNLRWIRIVTTRWLVWFVYTCLWTFTAAHMLYRKADKNLDTSTSMLQNYHTGKGILKASFRNCSSKHSVLQSR